MSGHRLVLFANGELGAWAIRRFARDVVAVVLHAPAKRRDGDALAAAIPAGATVIEAEAATRDALAALGPTHGLSVLYGHILRKAALDVFPHGVANLHPSLLPAGRGAHPNAWAIAKREPAGATLHLIDEGVDTGPILLQEAVPVRPADTAQTLYARLIDAARAVLERGVPAWLAGALTPRPQPPGERARRVADLERELRIDPDRTYTGREIIDLLRARTFPPHAGAAYDCDGARLRLRLDIRPEDA